MGRLNHHGSRSHSSARIEVARHDVSCPVLAGGPCDCSPEVSVQRYVRVCANCGGELADRRRAYCSRACRFDTRIRSKDLAGRQLADDIHQAKGPGPP